MKISVVEMSTFSLLNGTQLLFLNKTCTLQKLSNVHLLEITTQFVFVALSTMETNATMFNYIREMADDSKTNAETNKAEKQRYR